MEFSVHRNVSDSRDNCEKNWKSMHSIDYLPIGCCSFDVFWWSFGNDGDGWNELSRERLLSLIIWVVFDLDRSCMIWWWSSSSCFIGSFSNVNFCVILPFVAFWIWCNLSIVFKSRLAFVSVIVGTDTGDEDFDGKIKSDDVNKWLFNVVDGSKVVSVNIDGIAVAFKYRVRPVWLAM